MIPLIHACNALQNIPAAARLSASHLYQGWCLAPGNRALNLPRSKCNVWICLGPCISVLRWRLTPHAAGLPAMGVPGRGQRQPRGCGCGWRSWKTRVQHVPVVEVQAAGMPLLRLFGWKHCSVVVQVIWLSWVRVYYTKTSCKEGTEDEFQTLTLDNKQNPLFPPCFREEGEGSSSTSDGMQAVDQAETWHHRAVCCHCCLFLMQSKRRILCTA